MRSTYFACIVPGCGNNTKNNPQEAFFHLPQTVDILEKWARNMDIPDVLRKPESSRKHYKVCGMHFVASCFQTPEKKKLNRGVVPTILNLERDLILPEGIEPFQEAIPGPSENPAPAGRSQAPFNDEMVTVPLRSPDVSKSQVIPGKKLTNLVPGKRPYNILQMVDAKHIGDLSPRKAKYHRELVKATHLIATMRRRGATCVKKLFHDSSDIFVNPYMKAMTQIEQMPAVVQLFIQSQIRNVHKKSKARRYTSDEKSFYVALQKSSPRGYTQMRKFFSLPSPRTLNRALENISLGSGINEKLFSYLNDNSQRRSQQDRYCTLLFDEVSLRPHLHYNKGSLIVDGLETVSDERSFKIADHALVFMIRGLYKAWKQPIAFYFVQSTAKTFSLKKMYYTSHQSCARENRICYRSICQRHGQFK